MRAGRTLCAAGLGLATSLALAWSVFDFGVGPAPRESRWHGPSGHDWLVRVWPGPTVDVGVVSLETPTAARPLTAEDFREDIFTDLPHGVWISMMKGTAARAPGGSFWELRAYGWPCKCVTAGYLVSSSGTRPLELGWFDFRSPLSARRISIPTLPIWMGLFANTAVFAAPWWALLSLGSAMGRLMVRSHRRRRGCCPACGYDLCGHFEGGCPECGAGRPGVL